MVTQLPRQSHDLPPAPDTEKQFKHQLFRALYCIILLIDALIILTMVISLILSGVAPSVAALPSITILLIAAGIPAAVLTFLLYMAYNMSKTKAPYE